tara:strand:+ start:370 stop:576 length:207 start_codon:yes stop_codon:yes gene_type:complete
MGANTSVQDMTGIIYLLFALDIQSNASPMARALVHKGKPALHVNLTVRKTKMEKYAARMEGVAPKRLI